MQAEILRGLKGLAAERASVMEMIHYVQAELGFAKNFIVPVFPYFCEAFSLPLRDVLPLREWIGDQNDAVISGLLARLKVFEAETPTA